MDDRAELIRSGSVAMVFKSMIEHGTTTTIDMSLRYLIHPSEVSIIVDAALMIDYAKWIERLF